MRYVLHVHEGSGLPSCVSKGIYVLCSLRNEMHKECVLLLTDSLIYHCIMPLKLISALYCHCTSCVFFMPSLFPQPTLSHSLTNSLTYLLTHFLCIEGRAGILLRKVTIIGFILNMYFHYFIASPFHWLSRSESQTITQSCLMLTHL